VVRCFEPMVDKWQPFKFENILLKLGVKFLVKNWLFYEFVCKELLVMRFLSLSNL